MEYYLGSRFKCADLYPQSFLGNHAPEMTEKYLAAIETDVRILEALYHSTPRKWRHIIAEQSKSNPLAYSAETRWQRYGNVMITSAVSATVTAIVTALILHFI